MPIPIEYSCLRRMSTLTVPKQDIHFSIYDFEKCEPQQTLTDPSLECRDLEDSFCRNFSCCGMVLADLHDLLQHYEEHHVSMEEDEEEEALMDELVWTPPMSPNDEKVCGMDWSPLSQELHPQMMLPTPSCSEDEEDIDISYETEENSVFAGSRKRNFQQIACTNDAMDLLTLSAAKKLAMATGDSLDHMSDEEFLAHANVLLASANNAMLDLNADKPYKCLVDGCDKAYKNANGLKYHKEHGHCNTEEDSDVPKPYQCTIGDCGKRYKNLNGLKYHIEHSHMAALNHTLATFGNTIMATPFAPVF
ncbi:hypothetical protein DM01DRAFT_1329344 [Hesseltinella vesiculosa]|uniref:C2H2-type domain-containing protein n=1 Tax=Hesseltinella vesiculosa TaxID=101127 RepID=A0A1X2G3V7_9FUNG|nr:hypothetical protein DM01DRAFT_1329344 [Hesseltinella vesiculosa]